MQKKEFETLERKFLELLQTIHSDVSDSIKAIRDQRGQGTYIKSELCLAFISADTFSRIYRVFEGASSEELDKNNKGRFVDWFNRFALTEENDTYKQYREYFNYDADLLWSLRNSPTLLRFTKSEKNSLCDRVLRISNRSS